MKLFLLYNKMLFHCFNQFQVKMVQNVKFRSLRGWAERINERIHVINSDYVLIGLK